MSTSAHPGLVSSGNGMLVQKRQPYIHAERSLTWITQKHVADAPLRMTGPGRYCSPRHRMPLSSRTEGSKCVG